MPVQNPNVGVAFALVIGAGAATGVGASVVFFPKLVKLASRRVLAAGLGLSAGVMTYVSFVEIFNKSTASFLEAGHSDEYAYMYATLTFFGGVVTMLLVDFIVRCLSGEHHHHHDHGHEDADANAEEDNVSDEPEFVAPHCVGCSDDPVGELEEWQHKAEEEERRLHGGTAASSSHSNNIASNESNQEEDFDDFVDDRDEGAEKRKTGVSSAASKTSSNEEPNTEGDIEAKRQMVKVSHENKKLVKMGINTALAIAIHNFPEGLATFIASLEDPGVGAVLAIAIGIHNIPEGLCVALPIYYATGNRWKAFFWACMSGLSEPVGALLGWAVLANAMSNNVYAVLFGLVGGMMVIISAKELVPTAHRYDPDDTVVTYAFIAGMAIMALSLVLFQL